MDDDRDRQPLIETAGVYRAVLFGLKPDHDLLTEMRGRGLVCYLDSERFRATPRTLPPALWQAQREVEADWRCPGLVFDLLMTGLALREGLSWETLSDKSARIRRLGQGKRRPRFDPGNRDADDGPGGSLFCRPP
jgi:hypothetical protein